MIQFEKKTIENEYTNLWKRNILNLLRFYYIEICTCVIVCDIKYLL